jgi:hypothetical protein
MPQAKQLKIKNIKIITNHIRMTRWFQVDRESIVSVDGLISWIPALTGRIGVHAIGQ